MDYNSIYIKFNFKAFFIDKLDDFCSLFTFVFDPSVQGYTLRYLHGGSGGGVGGPPPGGSGGVQNPEKGLKRPKKEGFLGVLPS